VQSYRGATLDFQISERLSEALRMLSQREGVTLFMLLLAAFKVILHRYSRQQEILIGTDVANRTRVEVEGLIGLFVNQLVLRTDVSGNPTFNELLSRIRTVVLEAYAHQDLPFDKLVEELKPERDPGRNPLFQVLFGLQNTPVQTLELTGLSASLLPLDSGTSVFDLSLYMMETAQGLTGSWRYSSDLFDSSTVASMTEDYRTFLDTVSKQPDASLESLLEILDRAEEQRRMAEERGLREASLRKFQATRRKAISRS
jgi:non-ribosomal peptide synthetase component F